MYHQLSTQLALDGTTVLKEWSTILRMEGYDALQLNMTLFRLTGTNVKVTIQESNDGENFRNLSGSTETVTVEGDSLGTKRTGIATR